MGRPRPAEPDPDHAGGGRTMAALDPRALRVYVLTSSRFAGRSHRDVAMAALEGGAGAVQLRAPELPEDELLGVASELARACADVGVLFERDQIGRAHV